MCQSQLESTSNLWDADFMARIHAAADMFSVDVVIQVS